jgi:hypothetical protein
MAAVGTPFAEPAVAAVVDALSGAVLLGVEDGRGVAIGAGGSVVVGGPWGVLWCDPVVNEEGA